MPASEATLRATRGAIEMTLASRLAGLLAVLASAASMACSSTAGPPLGGPYGGGSFRIGPTDGGYSLVDATYTAPLPPAGASQGLPGTWTHIFTTYMATGTFGNCTFCHHDMSDAPKSYKWLKDQDYVGASHPALTNLGNSCLSWYNGDMPPGMQPDKPDARMEMDMWSDAGGKNN
jgi:hypothetical protein